MSSTPSISATPLFVGEFCHAIDGKSRITIPSAWRFVPEAEFFLRPGVTGDCLKVMPLAELERLQSKANNELEGKARIDFLRDLGSGTRQCNLDKAGRLTLPEDFCEQLHLKGDVTLVGVLGIFEIWNVQTWNAGSKKTGSGTKAHFTAFGL